MAKTRSEILGRTGEDQSKQAIVDALLPSSPNARHWSDEAAIEFLAALEECLSDTDILEKEPIILYGQASLFSQEGCLLKQYLAECMLRKTVRTRWAYYPRALAWFLGDQDALPWSWVDDSELEETREFLSQFEE